MTYRKDYYFLKKTNMRNSLKECAVKEMYERGYRVSECGKYLTTTKNKLQQRTLNNGYPVIGYKLNKKSIQIYWHRLQGYQKFKEKIFEDGVFVRHKNNLKQDCSYENILIGTASENMMDCPKEDRLKRSIHASSFIKKYNNDVVKKFHSASNSYKKTMNEFNITSKGTLHYILNN